MTILTNNVIIKKPDGTKDPLVLDCVCEEEKVDIFPPQQWAAQPRRSVGALLCMTVIALLVATTGITCGLMLYRQHLRGTHRYQGFCSIPIDTRQQMQLKARGQLIEANYNEHRVNPLELSSTSTSTPDIQQMQLQAAREQLIEPNFEHRVIPLDWSSTPNFQFISTVDEGDSDEFASALREELDIDGDLERIRVKDNDRFISFVHDFAENVSGIIDAERCFITALDPTLVVPPEQLVVRIERGAGFDVSRVRTTLRAALPALQDAMLRIRALDERCADKPVYRLEKDVEPIIRKRSADAPPHDYMQFAGKHVQEIEISNLAELLDHEKNHV